MTGATPSDPDDALALDYVLGILREPELTTARRSERDDPAFSARVAAHRSRLFDEPDGAAEPDADARPKPRQATWDAIAARLGPSSKP